MEIWVNQETLLEISQNIFNPIVGASKNFDRNTITKNSYESWSKSVTNIKEIKKSIENIQLLHMKSVQLIKENNNRSENLLARYSNKPQPTTVNIAQLSTETNRILKRLLNISPEDSKSEIRENTEKLKTLGKHIPRDELQNFIEARSTIFDCAIRGAIKSHNQMKSIDEIRDFIIKKFVLKRNYDKN